MRKLLYLVLAVLSLSVVASCIDRPDIVLDEEQMIDLLVDVHRAEGLLEMQQQLGVGHGEDQLAEGEGFRGERGTERVKAAEGHGRQVRYGRRRTYCGDQEDQKV